MHWRLARSISSDDHLLGDVHAATTLVVYGDYESPVCGSLHSVMTIALRAMRGHLRVAFRHFPLVGIHPHAQHAAELAEAAGDRGRFWPMHDLLFAHQDALRDPDLAGYASAIGLDPGWAMAVLRVHTYEQRVRRDFLSGVQSGVTDAPTLFINDDRYEERYEVTSLLVALQNARYIARRT